MVKTAAVNVLHYVVSQKTIPYIFAVAQECIVLF